MSNASLRRTEGKLVEIARENWKAAIPQKAMTSIIEGGYQTVFGHLPGNPLPSPYGLLLIQSKTEQETGKKPIIDTVHVALKNAALAAPIKAPAPAAATAIAKAAPAPLTAPAIGTYTVLASSQNSPAARGGQVFIFICLPVVGGPHVQFKFKWNDTGKTNENWARLFVISHQGCVLDQISHTDEFNDCEIELDLPLGATLVPEIDPVAAVWRIKL